MARPILWAPSAERDVGRAWTYIKQRSAPAAGTLVRRIVATVDRLGDQPDLGRPADDIEPVGRYRAVVCAPYRIVYRVTEAEILVLRVWDTRRDPTEFQVREQMEEDE